MARIDDEEKVGRETICQACDDAHPWVNAHKHHGNHHKEHSEEYHIHGVANGLDNTANGLLNILRGVLHIDKIGWHTREHTTRPLGIFTRSLAVCMDVCRHTRILRYIALSQRLIIELWIKEECANSPEEHQSNTPWEQLTHPPCEGVAYYIVTRKIHCPKPL